MTKERVDEILRGYKANLGRLAYLEARIVMLEERMEWEQTQEIESAFLHSPNLDGLPHGNSPQSVTERVAVNLSMCEPEGMTGAFKGEIEVCKKEAFQKRNEVRYVEAWMKGLTERERFVTEKKIFDECFWRVLIEDFKVKFGDEYTKTGLKNIYYRAMHKIYTMAN